MPRVVSVRAGETAVAVALLAVALYVIWTASAMPTGTLALPGPGLFPMALGILLAIVATIMLGQFALQHIPSPQVEIGHREIAIALVTLAAVTMAFEAAGAVATFGLFLLILFKALARIQWWKALLAAALGTGALWLIFVRLLNVQLPGGAF